jgi:exodeoxyribonuclease VII large subunit
VSRTYLAVQYEQRNQVKALGARWDADAKKWFVPEGVQLQAFTAWLPQDVPSARDVAATDDGNDADELLPSLEKGIRLAHLLQGISAAVAGAYPSGVWTRLEVVDVSIRNHVYLEVADRDSDGRVLAKARAMIWSRTAQKILPEFEQATGMHLAPGIKLLVRARPTMHAEYGFGFEVDAIDPQYTLGDLEAKKRDIRTRLKAEGLWDRNRTLPAPWDFNAVLVVAPSQAAGLGDFQAEAQRLQAAGVCTFGYASSRFQGEGAAAEICEAAAMALRGWTERGLVPDAIVILRGGVATNDLAWLNEYCLARFICESAVPVFTGIGHQKDSTVLDEVAHTAFDTPSKVIAGIESTIAARARKANSDFEMILARAQREHLAADSQVRTAFEETRQGARAMHAKAARWSDSLLSATREQAWRHVQSGANEASVLHNEVRQGTLEALAGAKARAPILLRDVQAAAEAATALGRQLSASQVRTVTSQAANAITRQQEASKRALHDVAWGSRQALEFGQRSSEALFREVAGQGPEKTLRRGFAIVRDRALLPVSSATQARAAQGLEIQFHDGVIPARAQEEDNE